MNDQILRRVIEIASDTLEADVTAVSTPATVPNWDSVRHLNLILALEEEYAFQFLPEEMEEEQSITGLAELVASKQG